MTIEQISRKYEIDEDLLKRLEERFGSLRNFAIQYVTVLTKGSPSTVHVHKKIRGKLVNYYEINDDNLVGKKSVYAKFLADLYKIKSGFVFNGNMEKFAKMILEDAVTRGVVSSKQIQDIYTNYGINAARITQKSLSLERGVSHQRIKQTIDYTMGKISKTQIAQDVREKILNTKYSVEALSSIVEFEDVLIGNEDAINFQKKKFFVFYYIKSMIEHIEFKNDLTYFDEIIKMEKTINNSECNYKQKQELQELLKKRVNQITGKNKSEIIELIKDLPNLNRVNKQLNLSISRTEISKNTIEFLKNNGIKKLKDLLALSIEDLRSMEGVQSSIYREILAMIQNRYFVIPEDRSTTFADYNNISYLVLMDRSNFLQMCMNYIGKSGLPKRDIDRNGLGDLLQSFEEIYIKEYPDDISGIISKIYKEVLMKENLQMGVENMNVSYVIKKALRQYEIKNLQELLNMTKKKIKSYFGNNTSKILFEYIKSLGYEIPEDMDENILEYNEFNRVVINSCIDLEELRRRIDELDVRENQRNNILNGVLDLAIKKLQELYIQYDLEVRTFEEEQQSRSDLDKILAEFNWPSKKEVEWKRRKREKMVRIKGARDKVHGRIKECDAQKER